MPEAPLTLMSTYGRSGSSTRVRLLDWAEYLGLDARVYSYVGTADNHVKTILRHSGQAILAQLELRRLSKGRHPGALVLSRVASPFSNGRLEAGLLRSWEHSIYDFDDALFVYESSGLAKPWSKSEVWKASVVNADVVIAGSDYLAQSAAQYSDNVIVIPSCVDPQAYLTKSRYTIDRDYPLAVWLGSPSTELFLPLIAQPLLRLHTSHGLRLRVISSGASSLGALDQMVDRVQWTPENFTSSLAGPDFGIMPLPDTPDARGKCAYKLLQYGAAGLPVVADPVGANAAALTRMNGVSTADSNWHDAMLSILEMSATQRQARGQAGLRGVTEHYSFAAWEHEWRKAIHLPPHVAA